MSLAQGEVERRTRRGGARGLRRAAEIVHSEAVDLAPLLDGRLRESAHLEPEVGIREVGTSGGYVDVVFSTPYAAAQHEGFYVKTEAGKSLGSMQVVHVSFWRAEHYTTPGTGKHFLSRPLLAMEPRLEAIVAADVRRELELGA